MGFRLAFTTSQIHQIKFSRTYVILAIFSELNNNNNNNNDNTTEAYRSG